MQSVERVRSSSCPVFWNRSTEFLKDLRRRDFLCHLGWTAAAYKPHAVLSSVPHHLRVQTKDQAGNWSAWTAPPLFTFQYDSVPPLIGDLTPSNSSVITTAWPMISASLSDPAPGSGACPELCRRVQPLSTTLMVDSQVVTPQVRSAGLLSRPP
jgi:hypothetical protein